MSGKGRNQRDGNPRDGNSQNVSSKLFLVLFTLHKSFVVYIAGNCMFKDNF